MPSKAKPNAKGKPPASGRKPAAKPPPKAGTKAKPGAQAKGPAGKAGSRLVDDHLRSLGGWRGATLAKVRALIREADPDVAEDVKWRKPSNAMQGVPVWSHDGLLCTGESYKDKVKLTFARGAALDDPAGLFNAADTGGTRRAIDLREGETVDADAFKALVKAAVALNGPQGARPRQKGAAMTFRTSREIAAPPSSVFAAFEDGARLAAWWGPAGFSNTFRVCEFRPGGTWSYVMHGPDGKHYPNESVFLDIEPSRRVVVHHLSKPRYRLTVSLEPTDRGTLVRWEQEFEDPKTAKGVEPIVVPANEQNLDRLSAEVLRKRSG